ncbi:CRE-RPL-12 protein [Ochromonadaceae sp. CCMP2298]|nr:CRE-RPL-12 protein [Ochromonadaceae sp. CCMP2298]|mmetsp:Transcript_24002/g.53348  ORF Transcript_24002/g.53348 Transcript_24002/m.53348 type:complete len:167 (+) Transcript_24002:61-561(+)|eukprot:CAMPEP_0173177834 /NCGR_PEP_ID=MMETSP1141-20130122/5201_1 /TAXON_ID=483371 /ORGANISM="non described non described, Strain CCMP2298" /LENGTH=166 /DNA_ID=CAMNT_0014100259 /DNA_START=57 /DNA_END=557 /DNA_ORIENTATION=-
MAPPPGPAGEEKIVLLKAVGGEIGSASALAPKLGPLGLSPKKVGEDIQKATMEWKGIKVMVRLSVINRVATPTVVPSASAMIMKELKEPPRDRKKVKNVKHSGNVTLDAIINIARVMRSKSMAKALQGTVLEVLGTAFSIGCTVDGVNPHDLQTQIKDGEVEIPAE